LAIVLAVVFLVLGFTGVVSLVLALAIAVACLVAAVVFGAGPIRRRW
jgi:hypothetical protein